MFDHNAVIEDLRYHDNSPTIITDGVATYDYDDVSAEISKTKHGTFKVVIYQGGEFSTISIHQAKALDEALEIQDEQCGQYIDNPEAAMAAAIRYDAKRRGFDDHVADYAYHLYLEGRLDGLSEADDAANIATTRNRASERKTGNEYYEDSTAAIEFIGSEIEARTKETGRMVKAYRTNG